VLLLRLCGPRNQLRSSVAASLLAQYCLQIALQFGPLFWQSIPSKLAPPRRPLPLQQAVETILLSKCKGWVGGAGGRRSIKWCVFSLPYCHEHTGFTKINILSLFNEDRWHIKYTWRTLVSAVMNFRVPWNVGNFLTSCKPVSFSRRTLHHGVSK